MWHTDFSHEPHAPLPHHLDVFFGGQEIMVSGIRAVPRIDGTNGKIGKYEVHTSSDGVNFNKTAAAKGAWRDDEADGEGIAMFPVEAARGVRLVAMSGAEFDDPWTSLSEFYVFGAPMPPVAADRDAQQSR
jgi:F5/8 type C domain